MRILCLIALLFHGALSAYAIATKGYLGAFPPFESLWNYQIFSDLVVAIGLLWYCLWREARQKGRPLWKVYLCGLGILLSGSLAPLLYLLIEKDVFQSEA